jgi:hypothetical protein
VALSSSVHVENTDASQEGRVERSKRLRQIIVAGPFECQNLEFFFSLEDDQKDVIGSG